MREILIQAIQLISSKWRLFGAVLVQAIFLFIMIKVIALMFVKTDGLQVSALIFESIGAVIANMYVNAGYVYNMMLPKEQCQLKSQIHFSINNLGRLALVRIYTLIVMLAIVIVFTIFMLLLNKLLPVSIYNIIYFICQISFAVVTSYVVIFSDVIVLIDRAKPLQAILLSFKVILLNILPLVSLIAIIFIFLICLFIFNIVLFSMVSLFINMFVIIAATLAYLRYRAQQTDEIPDLRHFR